MNCSNNMNTQADIRKLMLLFINKLWIVLVSVILCILIGVIIYKIDYNHKNATTKYSKCNQYHVDYGIGEFSYVNGGVVDNYNAYTWDSILRTDNVVDRVMQYIDNDDITKDYVKSSVRADLPGDFRYMNVYITCDSKEKCETIAGAYVIGLRDYSATIEGLAGIDIIDTGDVNQVISDDKLLHAGFLGGLVGIFIGMAIVIILIYVDDSFYVERDITSRYPYELLGIITDGDDNGYIKRLVMNARYRCVGDNDSYLYCIGLDKNIDKNISKLSKILNVGWNHTGSENDKIAYPNCIIMDYNEIDYDKLRNSMGVIIAVKWGICNSGRLDRLVDGLCIQDVNIKGIVLIGARERFLRGYYGNN